MTLSKTSARIYQRFKSSIPYVTDAFILFSASTQIFEVDFSSSCHKCNFSDISSVSAKQILKTRLALGTQPKLFQSRRGLADLGHFSKLYVKIKRKKAFAAKNFGAFSPKYSQNYILNGRFNPRMNTIRDFFLKIRALFTILKKGQGRPPPLTSSSSCAPELCSASEWLHVVQLFSQK